MKKKNSATEKVKSTASRQVPFSVIEAYKSIRTNLQFVLAGSKCKIFEITSPCPNDGKSSCAVNLAIAYSQLNQKVLLLDCDLRKPSVHRKLHLNNSIGVSSLLIDSCNLSDALVQVNSNLDVIPSGPLPPNPAELLSLDSMGILLESLKNMYDCIIIDTPPLSLVSDALVFSHLTQGLVIVAKDGVTPIEDFEKAKLAVEHSSSKILGVIINESEDTSLTNYKSKKYSKYY